jgi:hypothetical protein
MRSAQTQKYRAPMTISQVGVRFHLQRLRRSTLIDAVAMGGTMPLGDRFFG